MWLEWITTSGVAVAMIIVTTLALYTTLLLFTRLAGLRTFAKMSSFDFAITVAMGSLLASSILTKNPPLLQAIVALASLFMLQYIVSRLRHDHHRVQELLDNQPMLLMAGSRYIEAHLAEARVTKDEVRNKLRGAGVINYDQVLAVVLETTGDVSVLKKGADVLDLDLLQDVRGKELLQEVVATQD